MPHLDLLKLGLWILPGFIQGAIVCKMAASKSRHSFPWFFRYMVFQTGFWAALQYMFYFGTRSQYFYTYCAASIVGAGLSFAAIYEIFGSVFRPYDALRDFAAVMFRWAGLVLVLVALVQALSTQGNESRPALTAILMFERSISVIACGLLLFLLLFSKNLGIDWKHSVFGIALGFGLGAGIELGLVTARIVFGCPSGVLSVWRSIGFNATLLIWTYYVFAPEHKTAEAFAPKLILERWNQVLRSVNRPAPQGAFMPNLEKIVDEVLAHQASTGTVH